MNVGTRTLFVYDRKQDEEFCANIDLAPLFTDDAPGKPTP